MANSRLPSSLALLRWPSIPVSRWRSNFPGKSPTDANSSIGTKLSGIWLAKDRILLCNNPCLIRNPPLKIRQLTWNARSLH